ncbi:hypothetical protein ACFELD_17520 [Pseudomonas aeruginosa]|uniref:hypothetical protein n=1 Tax=Pseudomonas aeruginosa TaxID=287 RepID=UPI00383A925F
MSKELNKAPVEQAGGDERVIGWRERILAAHPNSDPGFWPDALLVEHMAAEIADLRAALAQPSPTPELPERGTQHRFSTNEQNCRHDFAGVWWNDNGETKTGRECRHCGFFVADVAEAAAEQAEAERPEVVAWRYGSSGGILSDKACLDEWKSGGEYQSLMTVAQHERILRKATAAQAGQLHELDKQCRDDVARALGLTPQGDGYAWSALLADIKTAAKVAQAWQVPEIPFQWSKSLSHCWPKYLDDKDGDWCVGTVDEDGRLYEVLLVEASQYDAPGESQKIAEAIVALWTFAAAPAQGGE